jgi:hypothetical protein
MEKGENSLIGVAESFKADQKRDLVVTDCLSPAAGIRASCCDEPGRVLWSAC